MVEQPFISWPSPVKINLFLHINRKREDGYHDLQTLFQLLDWGETLEIRPTNDDHVTLFGTVDDVAVEQNLIYRAAMALKAATQCKKGAHIKIDKKIPTGGGLGGGSSNAATTLVALNHHWQLNLSSAELQKIGLTLGADVPIFVFGYSAFAEGIGEQLTPTSIDTQHYLIVHPKTHVATAKAFASRELVRNTPLIKSSDYSFNKTRNDFEPVVKSLFPEVAKAFDWLIEYAPTRLTGTGACLFSCFSSAQQAQQVLAKLPDEWFGFVAQGVDKSPLLTRLAQLKEI